jgi:predicted RNase H-like HicB family nuclease
MYYVALVHKDANSDFGVSFPDFPGCISAGKTLQEALAGASEALRGHAEILVEDGETLPAASSLDEIFADEDNRDGIPVLVAGPPVADRALRVNVTLPESILRRIDEVTDNRSKFLATVAARALRDDAAFVGVRTSRGGLTKAGPKKAGPKKAGLKKVGPKKTPHRLSGMRG